MRIKGGDSPGSPSFPNAPSALPPEQGAHPRWGHSTRVVVAPTWAAHLGLLKPLGRFRNLLGPFWDIFGNFGTISNSLQNIFYITATVSMHFLSYSRYLLVLNQQMTVKRVTLHV